MFGILQIDGGGYYNRTGGSFTNYSNVGSEYEELKNKVYVPIS